MIATSRWRGRAIVLCSLAAVPFVKFVVWSGAGLLRPETAAALALLAIPCLLLSRFVRGAAYYALVALCIPVFAAYPAQRLLPVLMRLQPWPCAALIVALTGAAMWIMRERFFPVLLVFVWSGLAVEVVSRAAQPASSASPAAWRAKEQVLWLVLDEHLGLAAFPACEECTAARARLERTLAKHNFTLYPNAFGNYAVTVDSLSSLLNGRLLKAPGELIEPPGHGRVRHYRIVRNRVFDGFAAQGYRVVAYQHGSLRLCPETAGFECHDYLDRLSWLGDVPCEWTGRFRWLVGAYQASDPWLAWSRGFFPFRFRQQVAWPLAASQVWPDGLTARVLAESRRSLIFAHLLTPHAPYLFRRDGSIRPLAEWAADPPAGRLDRAAYDGLYRRYCEQVEFVTAQLDALLRRLDRHGRLRQMTVVIHGDHGSRIRRQLRNAAPAGGPEALDYTGDADPRDLLDRFATLLAVKRPGATAPAVNREWQSVLTFLSRDLFHREPEDGAAMAGRVYLVDANGEFQGIDIRPKGENDELRSDTGLPRPHQR